MRVKICGLRDAEHMRVAADSGADFLGLVFVEGVRRQLSVAQAEEILRSFRQGTRSHAVDPTLVGLFRNQPAEWVQEVIARLGLNLAQLCGSEDLDYAKALGVRVVRQIRVKNTDKPEGIAAAVRMWLDAGHIAHLDAYDPSQPGGAGRTFDWRIVVETACWPNVLLAGGLTPGNVAEAIRQVHPWGVDVSTGVETDGVKDSAKIRSFIQRARSAT